MSFYVLKSELSDQQQLLINQKLYVEQKRGIREPIHHIMYQKINIDGVDAISIPFAFYTQLKKDKKKYQNFDLEFDSISGTVKDTFILRDNQKDTLHKTFKKISKYHTTLLNLSCSYGKTCMAVYMGQKLGLKWIFVTPRRKLTSQTKRDSIMVTDEYVQIVDTDNSLDPKASGYILTMNRFKLLKPSEFQGIGTLILDEIHALCTPGFYPKLFTIFPKYLIAMTATPYRSDGLASLIDLYIEPKSHVIDELIINFDLEIYRTSLQLKSEINIDGSLNWTSIIKQQSSSLWRNKAIAELIKYYIDNDKSRRPLILCKHKIQASEILYFLNKFYPEITKDVFMGKEDEFDETAQVLITITSKAGLGFDGNYDTCFLACDITDPHQLVGRIGRRPNQKPIVIDFIDNHNRLWKHFENRRRWYKSHGLKETRYGYISENYIISASPSFNKQNISHEEETRNFLEKRLYKNE